MLTRRIFAASIPAVLASPAWAADSFQNFLAGVRAEAQRGGVAPVTLDRALAGLQPNAKVLEHFNHQPEFTMTWAQYRALLVTDQRAANGRAALRQNAAVMQAVENRFGVDTGVVVGIWGLESSFGQKTGDYNVVEALATLAWQTKRAAFFRSELIAALHILDSGDITAGRMTGSYAGAMGQPQFMPSSYLRYAVDFEGNGKRDIWGSKADTLASIANYLEKAGWRGGLGWGEEVTLPGGFSAGIAGRDNRRPVAEWARMGVRRRDGGAFAQSEIQAAVLIPDGVGGDAFLAYHPNFAAIRRYNPSDYYAIAVGLIGDSVTA
jgi:membrane-bound lytic murein transglycosylase B